MRAIIRRVRSVYRDRVEPRLALAVGGRPRPLVWEARSAIEYEGAAAAAAGHDSRWIETTWFLGRDGGRRTWLRGYCAVCAAWGGFCIDHTVGPPGGIERSPGGRTR